MEILENIRFNRIHHPKGATVVDAGTWTVGTVVTGKRKTGGKYETIGFLADASVNTGIDTKAKYNIQGYKQDGKFGKQFVVQKMEMILDTKTLEGLEQALGLIMSELMAERMVEHFKSASAVIEAFESKDSEEFMKVKGMTKGKLEGYYQLYGEKIQGQEAIMKLTPLGFTPGQAKDIYEKYKDMDLIMEMLDEAGMYDFYLDGVLKFHEAEVVGRARGIDFLNQKRIGALIVAYYKQPFQDDSFFTDNQINSYIIPYRIKNCGDGLNRKHFNSALSYLSFKKATHRSNNKLGLKVTHDVEFGIYQTIKELNDELKHRISTPTDVIESVINSSPFALSDEQREAVYLACTNGVTVISGNAGAGKSTILGIITKIFKRLKYDIDQVALSGKAALRIEETTKMEAKTIHRWYNGILEKKSDESEEENTFYKGDISNPYLNVSKLDSKSDVLILDEASMVGGTIMFNLLEILKESSGIKHIVIVGDNAQLPPIGIGQAFTDLLNYGDIPKAKLTKVYRQASESGTLAAATMIRQNQNFIPKLHTFGQDFKHRHFSKGAETIAEFDRMLANNNGDLIETQIIAMTNRDVGKINVAVQKHLDIFSPTNFKNKDRGIEFTIYEGSKVMLSENLYTNLTAEGEDGGDPVFNGNIGIVKKILKEYMVVDFAGIGEVGIESINWVKLRLGYAITIHKSQGSGFNSVIAIVNDGVEDMLTSNMLYTAITRAKNECTLISNELIVDKCANKSADERQTWLPIFYGGKE
ncbi:AAA family ATPase [Sporosarcina psychrophila]|uniref:Exodeoxyribonuclease V alpha subunit n=1 Tax=Sporosarcina psychrophila TaxID=1476 RepID=A0ABV2KBY4_SPOPS